MTTIIGFYATSEIRCMRFFFFIVLLASTALSCPALAKTHPTDCVLTIDNKTYIRGVCEFSSSDAAGSFSIYGEEYWASVDIKNGKGSAYWNAVPTATHAQAPLGDVVRKGGCWEGPRVRVCALALSPIKRDRVMASRPKGLRLWPSQDESLCISARDYQFTIGAKLVVDRCDFFWGIRQRVFSLNEGKISFEGKPDICVSTRSLKDSKETGLVIDSCGRSSIKWVYDNTKGIIRSDRSDLCWDFHWLEVEAKDSERSTDEWPHPVIAHSCNLNAQKNGQFNLGESE